MWAGVGKRELCDHENGRNPSRQSVPRDGKESESGESEAGENGDQKMNRNAEGSAERGGRRPERIECALHPT